MTAWHILHGDILARPADGLVCSANPNLNLSGGVGGAFALRYGDEMQRFLHSHLPELGTRFIPIGDSVIAPACGSPYVAVAHAVSIDAFYDTDADAILRTYDSAVRGLAARGCQTIAATCLGCGYGRFPDRDFATLAVRLFQKSYVGVEHIWLTTTNESLVAAVSASVGAATA